MINSSSSLNREKSKIEYSLSLQVLLEIEIDLIFTSIDRISFGVSWTRLDKLVETSIYNKYSYRY